MYGDYQANTKPTILFIQSMLDRIHRKLRTVF